MVKSRSVDKNKKVDLTDLESSELFCFKGFAQQKRETPKNSAATCLRLSIFAGFVATMSILIVNGGGPLQGRVTLARCLAVERWLMKSYNGKTATVCRIHSVLIACRQDVP